MDVKISWFAVLWKRIWGGKKAVFEYLLDKANTLVSSLSGETQEKIKTAYGIAKTIYDYMVKLGWVVPKNWTKYYDAVMSCFKALLDALEDMQVTQEELARLIAKFQVAYAVWKADDVAPCDDCGECADGSCTPQAES